MPYDPAPVPVETVIFLPDGGQIIVQPVHDVRTGRMIDLEAWLHDKEGKTLIARGHSQSVNAALAGLVTVYTEGEEG